jgi:hypothetical protein
VNPWRPSIAAAPSEQNGAALPAGAGTPEQSTTPGTRFSMGIPIRKLFFWLLFIQLGLLILHFFPEHFSWTISRLSHLDVEANVPTWYSSMLLSSVALSSLPIYLANTESNFFKRNFWLGFSFAYFYLSLDETAQFHEVIDKYTSIKWPIVYAPFATIFLMICSWYFLIVRYEDKELSRWILPGLILSAIGSMFFEMVSYLARNRISPSLQQWEFVCEEGLELLGTTMVLMGCFFELNRLYRPRG